LSIAASIALLAQEAIVFFAGTGVPQWGLFTTAGIPVLVGDNVVTFGFKSEWSISDYPLEQGAFESYDKVTIPFESRIRYSVGGDSSRRQSFLASLLVIAGNLELYNVITPDAFYPSVNITRYSYDRSAINGAGLLVVDVHVVQVRVTATQAFSNTLSPSSANSQSGGQVQTIPASQQQAAAVQMLAK
jgi:hypothetical protein